MTIKEAFEQLAESVKKGMKNPFFVMRNLGNNLADIADEVDDAGSYSTTEHVVGKWTDGSDIYEKVINFGALPNNATKNINHNITNLGTVISITGVAQTTNNILPIPYVSLAALNEYGVIITVNNTAVSISTGRDRTDYNAVVTLRYTKSAT